MHEWPPHRPRRAHALCLKPRSAFKQNPCTCPSLAHVSQTPPNVQTQRLGAKLWFLLALAVACRAKQGVNQKTFPYLDKLSPAPRVQTNLASLQNDDGQWVMPAKNYASTRFSSLNQINTGNVANLRVASTFSLASDRGEEAAPLIVNDTMYVVSPFPNTLYALDLTKPGAPAKWSYKPKQPNNSAKGVACCDWVNRGCDYANGKIF